ncbi:MAG: MBL fold metallo-hydrolase [Pseudomonadota bacterium]
MSDILTIDGNYDGRADMAAAYLLVDSGEGAFIDNVTSHAVPQMLEALTLAGLRPEDVRYLIITHVHLDHAGGTSSLLQRCPNAQVIAHPRAAPHVIDPARLLKSARQVYGDEAFDRVYGQIDPVPEARVRSMEDGETLVLGSRTLTFHHTRGHANHHFCIADSGSGSVFTGDAFGVHYPPLQEKGVFAFPSTSPTDFDGPLARESIRRLVDLKPTVIYPTHFGALGDVEERANQMIRHLEFSEQLMLEAQASDVEDEGLAGYCDTALQAYFQDYLAERGLGDDARYRELMAMDLELNAQGLAFVAAKRRRKEREARAAS